MPSFRLAKQSRAVLPGLAFRAMAKAILGPSYKLTFTLATPSKMRELNKIYRGKDKPTDILSFPLSKKEGEIYLCFSEARKEAPKFDRKIKNFIGFLFIHGCVHLKGYDHGATMERIEGKFRDRFKI